MGTLDAKVALVTGAASGIGREVALRLAADGAAVVIGDVDRDGAKDVAAEVGEAGGTAVAVGADVSVAADVEALVAAAVDRFGRLDVVVNNAGVAIPGTVVDTTEEDWDRVFAVNLRGVWLGMKYSLPPLRAAGGGAIVNMASVQALLGVPGWAGYAATKGAIISLSRQAAVEYAPDRIRVNCVAPGTVMTPMNERILGRATDPAALMTSWSAAHALGRVARPDEVAAAVSFLAGEDASFVTGVCLPVDGGMTILGGPNG